MLVGVSSFIKYTLTLHFFRFSVKDHGNKNNRMTARTLVGFIIEVHFVLPLLDYPLFNYNRAIPQMTL